jgi:septal ring factor EnvC (AmiA/AmiB activator)
VVREDVTKAREEAAKAREDLVPLSARVKELEEDVALVGRHRDTLNVQIRQVTARFEALKDEVATLSGAVQERDEALLNARQEIETLRADIRDRDGALQALERTCGGLRDEVVGWQTHSEGKLFVAQRPWRRGPIFVLTRHLCSRAGEGAAGSSGGGQLLPEPLRGRGPADTVAPGRDLLRV